MKPHASLLCEVGPVNVWYWRLGWRTWFQFNASLCWAFAFVNIGPFMIQWWNPRRNVPGVWERYARLDAAEKERA